MFAVLESTTVVAPAAMSLAIVVLALFIKSSVGAVSIFMRINYNIIFSTVVDSGVNRLLVCSTVSSPEVVSTIADFPSFGL